MSERVESRAEDTMEPDEAEPRDEGADEASGESQEEAELGLDDAGVGDGEESEDPTPEELEEASVEAELGQDLNHLQGELEQLNDQHLRLAAEFKNYRRRAETEMSQAWSRGQADLLRHLLDALDDLQRVGAWEPETTSVESLVEGVDLVERKIRQALEAAGVEVIDPEGEIFDPNHMEAMFRVPAESEDQEEQVAQVLQKGYMLDGHLVRPARVGVFKHD